MKIDFRPKFSIRTIGVDGSYQITHEDHVMTVLKGKDIMGLSKIQFIQNKDGWYSHLYEGKKSYTGMSGNNSKGVLGRTRDHLNPNYTHYKPGIETVIVLTTKHRNLSTDILYALEHVFTQLSFISGSTEVINATGTNFNLRHEEDVYDFCRSYAIFLTMFKNQGFTQYNISTFKELEVKGPKKFKLADTNVVLEHVDKKKMQILAGSSFALPENVIVEHCTCMSAFNELVKTNVVLPVYNEEKGRIELVFTKDYVLNKRFNLDELTTLFKDELVNNAGDTWRNATTTLNSYLNGNNNVRVAKRTSNDNKK